jgi:hypothetical protein
MAGYRRVRAAAAVRLAGVTGQTHGTQSDPRHTETYPCLTFTWNRQAPLTQPRKKRRAAPWARTCQRDARACRGRILRGRSPDSPSTRCHVIPMNFPHLRGNESAGGQASNPWSTSLARSLDSRGAHPPGRQGRCPGAVPPRHPKEQRKCCSTVTQLVKGSRVLVF